MSKIEQREFDATDGAVYRLVLEPTGNIMTNMCHLRKGEELSNNENYSSYRAAGDIPMAGIVYIDTQPDEKEIQRLNRGYNPHYVEETYEEYLKKLEELDPINMTWIKKIISGDAEQEKVLERNSEYIVARDWKFDISLDEDGNATFKREDLHILGIPIEQIGSIRDIEPDQIPMLNEMKEKALYICEETFGMKRDEIKIYFHYPPTTYHLHVHYTWVGLDDSTTNFERALDYDTVMRNIALDPNYYRSPLKYVKYNR
jgi:Scavenger mRNA decapping enzyme C-term binding